MVGCSPERSEHRSLERHDVGMRGQGPQSLEFSKILVGGGDGGEVVVVAFAGG